ncbi:predicted protein [Uncinocarpus reesii 1704]|uniref:Glycosyltransferase family 69 protein n=1 Tax=Uncinocarpus reesii (strain UAMH 1704) TaxID=336963 RepID=C4JQJ8_UNCRE|nr:uncharacterized protein UREG_03343 [Uncinocarpus reesii 1704]EEP78497.1 predicted protein [Uncinocarpus reesii 1704]
MASVPFLPQHLNPDEERCIELSALYGPRGHAGSFAIPRRITSPIKRVARLCKVRTLYLDLQRVRSRARSRWSRGCYQLLWFLALEFALLLTVIFILVSISEAILYPSYQNPPKHYEKLRRRILNTYHSGRGNVNNEKVFIAANIINEELIRGPWGAALVELIEVLGEENVFVSIYENDGGNGTSAALQELRQRLPCNSSIAAGAHLPLSQPPTVILPNGERRIKRIAYLAEVRNRVLRPLDPFYNLEGNTDGFRRALIRFDKILFLNDVYFSPIDTAQLLFSTNVNAEGRANYRAACAIDFISAIKFYDTFVVRDAEGYEIGTPLFPWFSTAGTAKSRRDVLAEKDAVRVRSCWGGMVAFDAQSTFQRPLMTTTTSRGLAHQPLSLLFRHEPELFWEAAECCLIFADLERRLGKPDADTGSEVFVNPYVRVAYSRIIWEWMRFVQRYERGLVNFQRIGSAIGYPRYNPRRLHDPGQLVREKVWVADGSKPENGSYQLIERSASPGGFCGERRMFVMQKDVEIANRYGGGKNWEEIRSTSSLMEPTGIA